MRKIIFVMIVLAMISCSRDYSEDDKTTETPQQEEPILESYSLVAKVDEIGTGSVVVNPSGDEYIEGTLLTITAIPENGYKFLGWSEDINGTVNPYIISINKNMEIKAHFSQIILEEKEPKVIAGFSFGFVSQGCVEDYIDSVEDLELPSLKKLYDACGTTAWQFDECDLIGMIFNVEDKDQNIEGFEVEEYRRDDENESEWTKNYGPDYYNIDWSIVKQSENNWIMFFPTNRINPDGEWRIDVKFIDETNVKSIPYSVYVYVYDNDCIVNERLFYTLGGRAESIKKEDADELETK